MLGLPNGLDHPKSINVHLENEGRHVGSRRGLAHGFVQYAYVTVLVPRIFCKILDLINKVYDVSNARQVGKGIEDMHEVKSLCCADAWANLLSYVLYKSIGIAIT